MKVNRSRSALACLVSFFVFSSPLFASQTASACDLANHCYGEVVQPSYAVIGALDGVVSTVTPTCLFSAFNSFATEEVWLSSPSDSYWVEVGYINNNNVTINGIASGLSGFWYDRRPGGGDHGHILVSNPTYIPRSASVRQTGTNTFLVNFGGITANSTSNSMVVDHGIIGAESTDGGNLLWATHKTLEYHISGGAWSSQLTGVFLVQNIPMSWQWSTQLKSGYAGSAC